MTFITENFLLHSDTACELYHEHAKNQPIFDYHCHLPPEDIASDRQFENLTEIWLEGDHYKWRAMRANGVDERYCTGEADPYEKFLAWARTVPKTLRNPLYHWSHLELKRYFGIDLLLNESTADEIWKEANEKLNRPEFSVHGILKKFRVSVICTTDDPTDTLEHHKRIAENRLPTRVYPAFRPDKALTVDNPECFNEWVTALEKASGVNCTHFEGFIEALAQRHDFFHRMGCRLSDHGMEQCCGEPCSREQAVSIYDTVRNGQAAKPQEQDRFAAFMMTFFGILDAEKGWVQQLHLGAMRNNNTRMYQQLGADTGFDSIGDFSQVQPLSRFLDRLESTGKLPKTIVYNNNPNDNYTIASMLGNFQGRGVPGKMQLGSGWWFLDQKEGIEWQINALSNLGLLSHFVGMLTDSRSFMSYPRHEYFRRVLCNLIGQDVERGELPNDRDLLGGLIEDICWNNAVNYFDFKTGSVEKEQA